jgi:Family of unknown function (DUF5681)
MKFRSPKPPHRGLFKKGQSGNPRGRPAGRSPSQKVRFDVKMAARSYCPETLAVIVKAMRSTDPRVSLTAACIVLDRGFGRPQKNADIAMQHRFVEERQVMQQDEWRALRGQPALPPPDDPDRKVN